MALILIRGENYNKIENSLMAIQNEGKLNLISKPKVIDHFYADALVESILKSKLRNKSKAAIAFFVRETTSFSITQIKNVHHPAHVTVVSSDYDAYSKLEYLMNNADVFRYSVNKIFNGGMIDYSLDKKEIIKNEKLNSYTK